MPGNKNKLPEEKTASPLALVLGSLTSEEISIKLRDAAKNRDMNAGDKLLLIKTFLTTLVHRNQYEAFISKKGLTFARLLTEIKSSDELLQKVIDLMQGLTKQKILVQRVWVFNCAINNKTGLLKKMLKYNSSMEFINTVLSIHNSYTPLQLAASYGHVGIAQLLISHEVQVSCSAVPLGKSSQGGETALREAIGGGHIVIVRLLISYGVNVNSPAARLGKSSQGVETALSLAIGGEHNEIALILLQHGADPNCPKFALNIAARRANRGLILALLAAGVGPSNTTFAERPFYEARQFAREGKKREDTSETVKGQLKQTNSLLEKADKGAYFFAKQFRNLVTRRRKVDQKRRSWRFKWGVSKTAYSLEKFTARITDFGELLFKVQSIIEKYRSKRKDIIFTWWDNKNLLDKITAARKEHLDLLQKKSSFRRFSQYTYDLKYDLKGLSPEILCASYFRWEKKQKLLNKGFSTSSTTESKETQDKKYTRIVLQKLTAISKNLSTKYEKPKSTSDPSAPSEGLLPLIPSAPPENPVVKRKIPSSVPQVEDPKKVQQNLTDWFAKQKRAKGNVVKPTGKKRQGEISDPRQKRKNLKSEAPKRPHPKIEIKVISVNPKYAHLIESKQSDKKKERQGEPEPDPNDALISQEPGLPAKYCGEVRSHDPVIEKAPPPAAIPAEPGAPPKLQVQKKPSELKKQNKSKSKRPPAKEKGNQRKRVKRLVALRADSAIPLFRSKQDINKTQSPSEPGSALKTNSQKPRSG